jgi:serine/threonine protein kinase
MLNLDQYLCKKHGELSEEEILRIAKQIASALDYARTVNGALYHGMLKLNNIALLEGSEGIHIALTDFGLSEIIGPAKILSRTLLHQARQLGLQDSYANCENAFFNDSFFQNFAFLAPEQKQPHLQHPKADIYALASSFTIF